MSLKARFFSSLSSSYLIQGLTSGVNFLLKLGLAWLIAPEDFGLFAIALFILTVINGIRDCGLETQVVRDSEPDYGSIFWFHLGSGVLCLLLTWLGAPLFAGFHPQLPTLLQIFAPIIIFSAISTVPLLYYNRTLQLQRTIVPRLVQLAVYAALAVFLAGRWNDAPGGGALALVCAKIVSEAALVAALWLRFRLPGIWRFNWSTLQPMLWRARFLYLLGLIELLAIDIDKAILSRNCSETVVGHYFMAWSLVFFLSKLVEPAFIRVLFPSFSRLQEDPVRAARLYTWATLAILCVEVPWYFALSMAAADVTGVLFPGAWSGMVPILSLLAFLPVIDPFSMLGVEVLRSRHQDRVILISGLLGLVVLFFTGNWLAIAFGGVGMVMANYLCHPASLILIIRLRRVLFSGYYQLLRRLPAVYLVALIPIAAGTLLPLPTPWARLAAVGLAVVIAWIMLALLFFRRPHAILNLERD